MLKKYPLPSNWREVPDANLDRCYYWNLETDEVSWLPPAHPRSHITQSAIKLKRNEDELNKQKIRNEQISLFLEKEMERKTAEAHRQASGSTKKKKKKKNLEDVRHFMRS